MTAPAPQSLPADVSKVTFKANIFEYSPTGGMVPATGKTLTIAIPSTIKELYLKTPRATLVPIEYVGTVDGAGLVQIEVIDPRDQDVMPYGYTLTVTEGWGAKKSYQVEVLEGDGPGPFDLYDKRGLPVVSPSPGVVYTKGDKGDPGLTAYQVWLANGNSGTQAQYLASLKGAQGNPSTVPGPSAYQVWLDAGNTGTQAQYLASLKGGKGDTGASAYQAWLDAGNTGDQAAYIASLKGVKGDTGPAPVIATRSQSTVSIGTGSKSFETAAGASYSVGQYLRMFPTGVVSTYMAGRVTSYSGTTLVVTSSETAGSGSYSDWDINVTGTRGQTGTTGDTGPSGVTVVNHGTNAATARPTAPVVYWIGTVRPTNMQAQDWWLNS